MKNFLLLLSLTLFLILICPESKAYHETFDRLYDKNLIEKIKENPKKWDELISDLHSLSPERTLLDYRVFQECSAKILESYRSKHIKYCIRAFKVYENHHKLMGMREQLELTRVDIDLTAICAMLGIPSGGLILLLSKLKRFKIIGYSVVHICAIIIWDKSNEGAKVINNEIRKLDNEIAILRQTNEFYKDTIKRLESQINVLQIKTNERKREAEELKELKIDFNKLEMKTGELQTKINKLERQNNELQSQIDRLRLMLDELKKAQLTNQQ